MITKDDLNKRHVSLCEYAKRKDSRYGSLPQKMFFSDGSFNVHNWNGGDGVIRQFTSSIEYEGYKKSFDFDNKSIDLIASWDYYDDQTYVQIVASIYDWDKDINYSDQYLITYYKSRGKTDGIALNGKQVNFDEYIYLLDMLTASGFKFDLGV